MPSDLALVLNRAADLITPPGAWTQGFGARDKDGHGVRPTNPCAISWCIDGSIRCVMGLDTRPLDDSLNQLLVAVLATREYRFTSAAVWQDQPERTQAEAVQLLRDAARLAEHEETTR